MFSKFVQGLRTVQKLLVVIARAVNFVLDFCHQVSSGSVEAARI